MMYRKCLGPHPSQTFSSISRRTAGWRTIAPLPTLTAQCDDYFVFVPTPDAISPFCPRGPPPKRVCWTYITCPMSYTVCAIHDSPVFRRLPLESLK